MTDPAPRSGFARAAFLAWGVACYALFFACFLYAIAFIVVIWSSVPSVHLM